MRTFIFIILMCLMAPATMAQKSNEKKRTVKHVPGKTYKRVGPVYRTRSKTRSKRRKRIVKKKQSQLKAQTYRVKSTPQAKAKQKPKTQPKAKQKPKEELSGWDRVRIEWYRDVIQRGEIRGR